MIDKPATRVSVLSFPATACDYRSLVIHQVSSSESSCPSSASGASIHRRDRDSTSSRTHSTTCPGIRLLCRRADTKLTHLSRRPNAPIHALGVSFWSLDGWLRRVILFLPWTFKCLPGSNRGFG